MRIATPIYLLCVFLSAYQRDPIPQTKTESYVQVSGRGTLQSVDYDGHKFVIWESQSSGKGGFVHHPSCPCLKP